MTIPFDPTLLSSPPGFFYLGQCFNQNETTGLHYKVASLADCDVAFAVNDVRSAVFREMRFRNGESSWEVSLTLRDGNLTRQVRVGHFETQKKARTWFMDVFR